jgi:ABC-2 type transport system permease protein
MPTIKFLLALWKTNLQSAMEFRGAFIAQALGMILNNGMYFIFWIIFFDRFKQVRGWELGDMFLLFGVSAGSFGLVSLLFGNAFNLGEVITGGRLDYYLSLPKPVLLHVLSSRSIASGAGDLAYGFLSFLAAGACTWDSFGRFWVGVLTGAVVFVSFLVIVQSLAFWIGNSSAMGQVFMNAFVTFALYPASLFDTTAKFIMLTIIPAAFMGAIPAEFVRRFTWNTLGLMLLASVVTFALAVLLFRAGLRRYESGSAIQVEV